MMQIQSSLLLTAALLLAACADDPIGPPAPGRLVVSTLTQGNDPDLDGYQLAVDDGEPVTLLGSGADTLILEPGNHTVGLVGVAEHCAVNPGTSVEAEIVSGRTSTLAFEISCPFTGVQVSVSTSGDYLDSDGYRLAVDGADRGTISTTGTVLVKRLAPGPHSVSLSDLAANCTPAETSRTVTVVADAVVQVEFAVTCVAPVGTVRVTAPTTGPAPGHYRVLLWYDDGWYYGAWTDLGALPANGVVSAQTAPGVYWVELTDLGLDCSVSVPNPTAPFTLTHGSVVDVVFPVSCSAEAARSRD